MDSAAIDPLPPEKDEAANRKRWSTPKVLLGTVNNETSGGSIPVSDNTSGFSTHS